MKTRNRRKAMGAPAHPRQHRKGLSIPHFPLEHLAAMYAARVIFHVEKPAKVVDKIKEHRWDIFEAYEHRTGRVLTVKVFEQRIDKMHRNAEIKRIWPFLPAAIRHVQSWEAAARWTGGRILTSQELNDMLDRIENAMFLACIFRPHDDKPGA